LYKKELICLLLFGVFSWTCLFFLAPRPTGPLEMEFWMTGYTAEEGFDENTTTANGTVPDYGTVAVDPSVVKFGSIIYWPEYAETTGHYGCALDVGGAVLGYHLDWWYETDAEAARMTETATVLILRNGWHDWLVDPAAWGLSP
jgi:3D (Asp-Asp-Asp) domain-containing protein